MPVNVRYSRDFNESTAIPADELKIFEEVTDPFVFGFNDSYPALKIRDDFDESVPSAALRCRRIMNRSVAINAGGINSL